jgi:hypothetical protein
MRIFLLPQVFRLTGKERLPTIALRLAAQQVVAGRLGAGEADLGGDLFKKRIARLGGGKRGGYRFIIAYRSPMTERVVFVYAFAKNSAATLTPNGHEALALVAARLVTASDPQVEELVNAGQLIEVGTIDVGTDDE